MKKEVVNILYFICTIVLFHIFKDILALSLSFSLYLIYNSIFSSIKKDSKDKFLIITIIFIILLFISYFTSRLFNIKYLCFTNITMTLFCYLKVLSKDKKINDIFHIINIVITMLIIIIFKRVYLIYLIPSINYILLYLIIFIKLKKYKEFKNILKINYKTFDNKNIIIINIIKSSYLYFSLIILYYILINKYNYSLDTASIYLSKIFYYGIISYFIYYILNNIKDIKYILSICLLLMVISSPISYLLFGESSNILFNYIILIFFYLMQNKIDNKDNYVIIFIIGFIIKILFEIPLINACYRMGYDLYFGSILSSTISFIFTIIICNIINIYKDKKSFTKIFNRLLNIIYENIIYLVILVVFTLIVKVEVSSIISSILVIIFYIFISFLYYIIRKKFVSKKVQ